KRFKRNNGSTAKARASEQRKKANQRWKNCPPANGTNVPFLVMPEESRAEQEQSVLANANETASVLDKDRGVQGGKGRSVGHGQPRDPNSAQGNLTAARVKPPPSKPTPPERLPRPTPPATLT